MAKSIWCNHTYRFGKSGKYLNKRRSYIFIRVFPKVYSNTQDYVEKYFDLNEQKGFTKFKV